MQNRVDEGGKTLGQVAFEGVNVDDSYGAQPEHVRVAFERGAKAVKAEIVAWLRRIGSSGAASELERSAGIPWEPPPPPPPG